MKIQKWHPSIRLSNGESWILETPNHYVRFTSQGGRGILQVTFDHLNADRSEDGSMPQPWGQKFAEHNGWSILGVISKKHIWFREEELHDIFDNLKDSGFFVDFARVVFCGGSKGGYGAMAFSSASPGSTVVAFNPQSTLDEKIVSWETRYRVWDWQGRYIDGAESVKSANAVYLFYDKYHYLDSKHADRIKGDNVKKIKCNFLGHGILTLFSNMGILKYVMNSLVLGNFSVNEFRRIFRLNRTKVKQFSRNMFDVALDRKHCKMALRICNALKDGPDREYFVARKALLTSAIAGKSALLTANEWLKRVKL